MYAWLANAYVEDIELNKKFDVYDGTMEDAILVYGSVNDCQLLEPYYAPVIVPKMARQIQGTANITKLLIVPGATDQNLKISPSDQTNCTSALCLQHAAARRRAKSGRPSVSLAVSESLTALKTNDSVTAVKVPEGNAALPEPMSSTTTKGY